MTNEVESSQDWISGNIRVTAGQSVWLTDEQYRTMTEANHKWVSFSSCYHPNRLDVGITYDIKLKNKSQFRRHVAKVKRDCFAVFPESINRLTFKFYWNRGTKIDQALISDDWQTDVRRPIGKPCDAPARSSST